MNENSESVFRTQARQLLVRTHIICDNVPETRTSSSQDRWEEELVTKSHGGAMAAGESFSSGICLTSFSWSVIWPDTHGYSGTSPYICRYISLHMLVHPHTHAGTYPYRCQHICKQMPIHIHTDAGTYPYRCRYVSIHVLAHIQTDACTYPYRRRYVSIQMLVHIHTCAGMYPYMCWYVSTHMPAVLRGETNKAPWFWERIVVVGTGRELE